MIIKPAYLRQNPAWFHTRILVGAGAQLTPQFAWKNEITHVINCAFPEDSPGWFRSSYPNKYECMNAVDDPSANILDWYPKFEETLHKFLKDGEGVVFVHCQAGMNRSASLALAYVCKNFSVKMQDLYPAVKRQRPCMFQNTTYLNQVREFINGRVSSEKNSRNNG
jgi:protein-tyrosine phosphatase